MNAGSEGITVREAIARDREFILGLVPRLVEFERLSLHEPETIISVVGEMLGEALDSPEEGSKLLVAEKGDKPAGFMHLESRREELTREDYGYVAELAVSEEAEGSGAGRALLEAAESWARERGHRFLSLHVFAVNSRAKRFYEHLGYFRDEIRMVRLL